MTFANPAMLFSLLALVPLVAAYLLKVRPRRRPTTAYHLWEKILQDRRPNRLLYRLRDFLSLLMLTLVFSAIALSLAEPRWNSEDRKDLLILIDNSASMQTSDGNSTRLEQAKTRAADIVRALDGVQRAAVASVAHELRYASHLSDNPRELLSAVDQIEPTAESLRIEAFPNSLQIGESKPLEETSNPDSEEAAENTTDFMAQHRVLFLSDGAFGEQKLPEGVELLKIGQADNNIGLVAADLRFIPGGPDRLGLYFQLASTGAQPTDIDLIVSREVEGEPQLAKVIPVTVAPGVNPPQVFTIDDARPGRWMVELDHDDALQVDNVAYLVARKDPPITVDVAASDRFFLNQSVLAFSHQSGLLELVDQDSQITLALGVSPDVPRAIVLGPSGESPWWENLGSEIDVAAPRLVVEDHPALRHIDPTTIRFVGAKNLVAPPGSQILVESETGVPLIYVVTKTGSSAVVVNLDPVAAEFYYSAWFPVLVHSAAVHLGGREEPLLAVYNPPTTVSIPGFDDQSPTTLTAPDGQQQKVLGNRTVALESLGFYQLANDQQQWLLSSSLLSAEESMLNAEDIKETAQPIAQGSAPAHGLTLFAILLLTVESLLYYRRKVG